MIIKKIPKIEDLMVQLKGVSPSKYSQIREGCAFSVIVQNAINNKKMDKYILLPSLSPAANLGIIIHKLLEERVRGNIKDSDTYESKWISYVHAREEEISNNYPSLRNLSFSDYDKMYANCDATMHIPISNPNTNENDDKHPPLVEVPVCIPNYISGIVDRIKFDYKGIEIIDYKSGQIYDENGNIKENIIYQLHLYALCCEQQFNKKVNKLTIIQTSDLSDINIPIQRDLLHTLLSEIKSVIDRINHIVDNGNIESLQCPQESLCKLCNCKHMCKAYLQSSFRSENIVDGIVIDVSNKNFLLLQDKEGLQFSVWKLEDLCIDEWDFLIGKHLIFLNVSNRIGNVYKRTDKTIIFEI